MISPIPPIIVTESLGNQTEIIISNENAHCIFYEMGSLEQSKFSAFERVDFPYSNVGAHDLTASVLTHKKFQEENERLVPVLVFFHGGGFVTGHRLYEPWWSDWSVIM